MRKRSLLQQAMTLHEQYPSFTTTTAWIDGAKTSLAGRLCLLAGAERDDTGPGAECGLTVRYQGAWHTVPDLATELAGLTAMEGRWLFHWGRDIDSARHAVLDVEAGRAIAGRPYWLDPQAHRRFIDPAGRITVATHRRTVMRTLQNRWVAIDMADEAMARAYARTLARLTHATPYTPDQTIRHGSATA
jgi:hypothetical protein